MLWDPMKDYEFMKRNSECFTSLCRSLLPVICRIQGYAVAGGSDLVLCADLLVIGENAKIGYPTARVWGCPTTAMWVYRLGPERAKRMLLIGDTIDGRQAEQWGLGHAVPEAELEREVERLAQRIGSVPRNQLTMQKLMSIRLLRTWDLLPPRPLLPSSTAFRATLPKESTSSSEPKAKAGSRQLRIEIVRPLIGPPIVHSNEHCNVFRFCANDLY